MSKNIFDNAVRLAAKYPNTFQLPETSMLSKLTVGDNVKVCLNNERFWCLIKGVDFDKQTIVASVDNILQLNELKLGDMVYLNFYNIYDIKFN
jgi:Cu/Ag efflux protein CusF